MELLDLQEKKADINLCENNQNDLKMQEKRNKRECERDEPVLNKQEAIPSLYKRKTLTADLMQFQKRYTTHKNSLLRQTVLK